MNPSSIPKKVIEFSKTRKKFHDVKEKAYEYACYHFPSLALDFEGFNVKKNLE